jgi:hypothetical protein
MSCIKVADDFQQFSPDEQCSTTCWTTFFFCVPEFITVPSYEKGRKQQLPPSIRVVKTVSSPELPDYSRGVVTGSCDVIYRIEARVLKNNKVIGATQREIIVMPCIEPPPPLDIEDLRKEYQLYAASSMGPFWNPRKRISVAILSKEPRPIVFPTTKGECLSTGTDVLLNFRTQMMCNEDMGEGLFEPPFAECEVMVTLEAITYFVEHEKDLMMSVAEIKKCFFAILKTTRFRPQKRKMKLAGWKRLDDAICKSAKLSLPATKGPN